MLSTNKRKGLLILEEQNGFSLIIAILSMFILMALGFLALSVTTNDLQITNRIVGEKKALFVAETGIHSLTRNFTPDNLTGSSAQIANDPASRYTISTASRPSSGADTLPLKGYSIGGGQQWGQKIFNVSVTGENTFYGSKVQIDVGFGYGPVEITTMSR